MVAVVDTVVELLAGVVARSVGILGRAVALMELRQIESARYVRGLVGRGCLGAVSGGAQFWCWWGVVPTGGGAC